MIKYVCIRLAERQAQNWCTPGSLSTLKRTLPFNNRRKPATYLSFEVELCSSLYPPIGYWKRNYQTILLITIAKHSWLQLYNWVAMMIRRKNFACLNLQQNLQIWSPVFKDHVTTVSLLQEFSLNLKWQRHLCKKINSLKNLRGPFHYPLHIKY